MHIPDLYDTDCRDDFKEVASRTINEHHKKGLVHALNDIIEEEYQRLEENAEEHLSDVARGRAERFLRKVLEGDQNAAMQLLGSPDDTDRYQTWGNKEGEPWSCMIHGNLHVTDGIKLREAIVNAFPDLLRSERVKDLESIVDGLTRQIGDLKKEIQRLGGSHFPA